MIDTAVSGLITGASTGLGAVYADRVAQSGHNFVLVARDAIRMGALATRLQVQYNVEVEVLPADLTQETELNYQYQQEAFIAIFVT